MVREGQSRGKKGGRKHGRDKEKCARYRMKGQREKNKLKRLKKLERKAERLDWGNIGQIKSAINRVSRFV